MYDPPTKGVFNTVEGIAISIENEIHGNRFKVKDFKTFISELLLSQIVNVILIIFFCHSFFLFKMTEFQEAFNLFDNRGDGKIQLNQVSSECDTCYRFVYFCLFSIEKDTFA